MTWSTYRDIYWRFVPAFSGTNKVDMWHLVDVLNLTVATSYYFNANKWRIDQAIQVFLDDLNFGKLKESYFGQEGATPPHPSVAPYMITNIPYTKPLTLEQCKQLMEMRLNKQ
jgi:dolichyl-phosphate-mannose--protein O-mannosyl transferase